MQAILSCTDLLPPVRLPLELGLGRVLSAPVQAGESVPPFTNSAMDGYAARAQDLSAATLTRPVRLQVLADLPAGKRSDLTVGPGQAVRIMTGAPLPAGADCVVPVEETDAGTAQVEIRRALAAGFHVRRAGEDVQAGDPLLDTGTVLRPAELGLLAAVGCSQVSVHPAARVGIITTGDELAGPGEVLLPGQIRDTNSVTMAAQVRAFGGVPLLYPRVRDTRAAVREAVEEAVQRSDLVLTSGGVSVGEYDFVKAVLAEMGARPVFWRVAQKPGNPLAFWVLHGKPVLGIPGNPVATLVCLELYVRPVVRRLMGHGRLFRPERQARLADGYRGRADGRQHFLRVQVQEREDGLVAQITGPQGSAILSSMAAANALALIPPDVAEIPPLGQVQVQLTELPEDH
jgi:molybdopterin molybdotransferase